MVNLTFLIHTTIVIFVLLLAWAFPLVLLPIIFDYIIPSGFWGVIYMILPPLIHIALIFLYYKKGYSLFALPVGHLIFPLFLLFVMFFLSVVVRITPTHGDWALSAMGVSFIYFLPFALITLIISLIIRARA